MSAEPETQENNDSIEEENENLGENSEEQPEEQVDIDKSEELSEDEQYKIELDKWFEQLEATHGVAFANEMRTKILLSKQIAHALDIEAWAKTEHEMALERLKIIQEQNDAVHEQTQKLVEQANEQNVKSYARFEKFLADSEKRDIALETKMSQIMDAWAKKKGLIINE